MKKKAEEHSADEFDVPLVFMFLLSLTFSYLDPRGFVFHLT